jgi:concentrative nucleoside transporter, CNT family
MARSFSTPIPLGNAAHHKYPPPPSIPGLILQPRSPITYPMSRLIALLGLVVFLALAWILSNNRRRFPWRTVLTGLALQFACALFILHTSAGLLLFESARTAVGHLNTCSDEGVKLVFGALGKPAVLGDAFGPGNAFIFAISITGTIIFIAALSALLYHLGILQRIVKIMAYAMQRTMGTSGSESLAAASNIFLGQTEAALIVKPYIARMTPSEIMALMTAGMATIATGVMVVYGGTDIGMNAGHILTASVLSAPAALLVSKIMFPETDQSETRAGAKLTTEKVDQNSIDALCRGTSEGVTMAINVMAMLIAFTAAVALLNLLIGGIQTWCGVTAPVTLQTILGTLNAPFAWLMGVPWKDCTVVGQALGERVVLNEFVGYMSLAKHRETLDPRSLTIATYALCGFANFASIGIQIGGISAICPARRADLAKLGLRAMIAGLLACYITATVVGIILH